MKQKKQVGDPHMNALFQWALKHSDPQGAKESSVFHGKSEEEIQQDIEFIQNAYKAHTVDVGQRLKVLLSRLDNIQAMNRKEVFKLVFEIEEFVDNLDFADIFYRLNGLEILFNKVISRDDFKMEDVKIFCIKIIGTCLMNTKIVKFDTWKLHGVIVEKLKTHTKNAQFVKPLLFAMSSFITTNTSASTKFCSEMIKKDLKLFLKVYETNTDFNVRQKILHIFECMFIVEERRKSTELTGRLIDELDFVGTFLKPRILDSLSKSFKDSKERIILEKILVIGREMLHCLPDESKTVEKVKREFKKHKFKEEIEKKIRVEVKGKKLEEDFVDILRILENCSKIVS